MGNNDNGSRLELFFFGLYLEKLEKLAKICTVVSSHTYTTEKVRDERAFYPPLCKFTDFNISTTLYRSIFLTII